MTLQRLEYFLTAADHRSFSAAAQALHMAQPSLSDQIRRLEAELGPPLVGGAPPRAPRAGRRGPLCARPRGGRPVPGAARLRLPRAERTLAGAREAADSVREVREL